MARAGEPTLSYAEQICVNRCVSKLYLSRQVVEEKLDEFVDLQNPPHTFGQNLN